MQPKLGRRECLRGIGATSISAILGMGCSAMRQSKSEASSRTYHVDPEYGNDNNDGLTSSRPFKTYADRKFVGGDRVLFKRGSIIRDILHTCNGSEGAPVVYGAYGHGPKPVFLGSVSVGNRSNWVEKRPAVWRYTGTISSEVCNLVFNNGASCGILRWRPEDLKKPGDWHYTEFGKQHEGGGTLYLCSPKNPGLAYDSIECVLWGHRKLVGGEHDIVFENLSFQNSGVHGYQEFHVRHVIIRGCDFRFIGGAVWNRERRLRFGNAVELWDGASDVTVEGCLFDNIYDSGVTHQGGDTRNVPERIFFRNNLFVDIGLAAYESREPSREVYFEHNTCINAGGGFSMQGEVPPRQSDPYPQPVGYHVWAWMIKRGTQPGNVYVRNNIFYESFGPAVCLSIDPIDAEKFMLDGNCYWRSGPGRLIEWGGGRSYTPSEFARYQTECSRDQHGRIIKPRFVDASRGDYRQRPDSPCRDAGMRVDVRRR